MVSLRVKCEAPRYVFPSVLTSNKANCVREIINAFLFDSCYMFTRDEIDSYTATILYHFLWVFHREVSELRARNYVILQYTLPNDVEGSNAQLLICF